MIAGSAFVHRGETAEIRQKGRQREGVVGMTVTITRHPTRRGVSKLTTELWLPRGIHEVFDFFADAYNLEEITPPFLHFHVLTPKPVPMFVGQKIDYRLSLHGLPLRWQSEISRWEPPYCFVDQQVRGPYKLWYHLHTFAEQNGGTLVRDEVDFSAPGGWLAEWLLVRRDLTTIFTYRTERLKEFLGSVSVGSESLANTAAAH
jgi:ligand-binding SRPBCC domain-containing protein